MSKLIPLVHLMKDPMIAKALVFADNAHKDQVRKIANEPYILHPVRVACTMESRGWSDPEVLSAALLHDVIEDCNVTKQDLLNEGFTEWTVELVDALSRKPEESYLQFILRAGKHSRSAAAIKLCDIHDNKSDLDKSVSWQKKLLEKYELAEYILETIH